MAPRRASDARADADLDFERLYRGHRGDVFRAALRELGNVHDAEDVTQAAFVDAYRAVLRGTRPEAPRAWLLTIAENVRRRRFRTALRRPREEPLDRRGRARRRGLRPSRRTRCSSALAALPPEQRAAFLLREIVGLSYDEIAERARTRRSAPCRCCCSGRGRRSAPSSSRRTSPSAAASSCRSRAGSPFSRVEARSRSDAARGRCARRRRARGQGVTAGPRRVAAERGCASRRSSGAPRFTCAAARRRRGRAKPRRRAARRSAKRHRAATASSASAPVGRRRAGPRLQPVPAPAQPHRLRSRAAGGQPAESSREPASRSCRRCGVRDAAALAGCRTSSAPPPLPLLRPSAGASALAPLALAARPAVARASCSRVLARRAPLGPARRRCQCFLSTRCRPCRDER